MNRGQVSIFVIIGVIAIILLMLYVSSTQIDSIETESSRDQIPTIKDADSINLYAQSCVERVAQDSLIHFGLAGGGTGFFKEFFDHGTYRTPYYFVEGRELNPSVEEVEEILENFINKNLASCTRGFPNKQGLLVMENDPKAEVKIGSNSISFNVMYSLDVEKDDQRSHFDYFTYNLEGRFKEMIVIADGLTGLAASDETTVYWDYMTEVTRKGFDLTAHADRDNTLVYRLVDPQTQPHKQPLTYQFAFKIRTEWPGQ